MFLTRSLYPRRSFRGAVYEMDHLRREMDRIWGAMAGQFEPTSAGVHPLLNVSEDKDAFYVVAELPGVASEDLDISVENKSLTISGKRREPEVPEGARFHRSERGFATFSRVVGLPSEVDALKVEARAKDGILTITLPKAEAAKPRQITVQSN